MEKSQSRIFEKNLDLEIFAKRSPNWSKISYNWLVGCLGGNAVSSERALKIFLILRMKLGDY